MAEFQNLYFAPGRPCVAYKWEQTLQVLCSYLYCETTQTLFRNHLWLRKLPLVDDRKGSLSVADFSSVGSSGAPEGP